MVFDQLSNASIYRSLSPGVARGLDWLTKFAPDMADGRYEIDGDNVFALVQSYETAAPATKKFESHRKYLDIQYVAVGEESILYAPRSGLKSATTYDATKDFELYGDPQTTLPLAMRPGDFAIFYPEDGHKPGCIDQSQQKIKKVVIKARV